MKSCGHLVLQIKMYIYIYIYICTPTKSKTPIVGEDISKMMCPISTIPPHSSHTPPGGICHSARLQAPFLQTSPRRAGTPTCEDHILGNPLEGMARVDALQEIDG